MRSSLAALLLMATLAPTLSSCGEDVPRSLRLTIGVHVAVAQIDQITVQLIAGKDLGAGLTCTPAAPVSFSVNGSNDVPIVVDILPGPVYGAWVGYEVRWLHEGAEVSHRVGRQPWPSSGASEIEVMLEADCLDVPCAADANCTGGACISAGASPFDPTLRDPSAAECILRAGAP
jgi:hypothetical protein